jgi:aryl-alcohol dehydrogenase-like predicted oxidoreductase
MTLPTYRFGRSGMNITRLGFGSWAIGGGANVRTRLHEVRAGLERARSDA